MYTGLCISNNGENFFRSALQRGVNFTTSKTRFYFFIGSFCST
jgi:hypothetical protein